MRIIVLGKNSFVASHLPYEKVNDRLTTDEKDIHQFLDCHNPDIVINCIGYCGGRNIDDCELDKQRTSIANTILPIMLAGACEKRGIRMVHIGSGCIFSGQDPRTEQYSRDRDWLGSAGWNETDSPNPKSFYSKTKAAADLVLGDMKNVAVLRIRMPISGANHPRNLLSKITSYKQVVETQNSITFLDDLRRAVDWIIEKDLRGIFNTCSSRSFTHSEFLTEYKKYVPEHTWESITPNQLDDIVAAPRSNCLIDSGKLVATGFQFGEAKKQMEDCVREFAEARLGKKF